jgi:hypothetical protein
MQRISCVILTLAITYFSFGQQEHRNLNTNPLTGLVSIRDSVKVGPKYSISSMMILFDNWCNYTAYSHGREILDHVNGEKKIILGFFRTYEHPELIGKFYKGGQLSCSTKNSKGKMNSTANTDGDVSFDFIFGITGDHIVYEFTKFRYISSKNEMGKFEEHQILSNDGQHFLSEKQKPWNKIKKEYFDRFEILSEDLRHFLATHHQKPDQPVHITERW